MTVLLPNNAATTLSTAIDATETGLVVTDGSVFPTPGASEHFYVTLVSPQGMLEIVKVTARSGNVLTGVRGAEGTTPSPFAAGSRVEARVTGQGVKDAALDADGALRDDLAASSGATIVGFAPTGGISSGTVAGALGELDTDKVAFTRLDDSDGATLVGFNPTGDIAATTVAGAIAELDTEKVGFTRLDDSDGASLVGYTQGGAGSTTRTSQAKHREWVSVKDFGAVGDGVAVDTTAIQNAINVVGAAGGGTVFFPAGVYLIRDTIFVRYDNVTIAGASQGGSIITADSSFTGSGGSITATMIQINDFPNDTKVQRFTIRDIMVSATYITGGFSSNSAVTCLFHANWVHYMTAYRVTFYGADNGVDGIGALLTAVRLGLVEDFSMHNSFVDCEFTYNRDAVWWGAESGGATQGLINASQMYRCRIGGLAEGTGYGVWMRGDGYANSFIDNNVEQQNVGFNLNDRSNFLRGNLTENNSIGFQSSGNSVQLHGNHIDSVNSLQNGSFVQAHGTVRHFFVETTAPNMIVDPWFQTQLYDSSFASINTTVTAKSGDELGRNVCTFPCGASVTNRVRFLINNQGQNLRGWYTFVVRAKADVAGAGLYFRMPGTPDDYKFSVLKGGTSLTVELLEANAFSFKAGERRSGVLTTDYRVYVGSVYFADQALPEGELRLSAQDAGGTPSNVTVDYVGMFQGQNAFLPADDRVYERYTDVTGLTSGSGQIITELPFPDQVRFKATSVLNGAVSRSVSEANLNVANGAAAAFVYHYDLNSFGYDGAGSSVTDDHIYVTTNSQLQYFSRTASLAGTEPLWTKLYFYA